MTLSLLGFELTNRQRVGISITWNGSDQNVSDESLLHVRDYASTDVDNPFSACYICYFPCSKY
jgi:hypothetical protein